MIVINVHDISAVDNTFFEEDNESEQFATTTLKTTAGAVTLFFHTKDEVDLLIESLTELKGGLQK